MMEERRKIIIQTGADPDATLSQPFFNTEATRAARPVVPLPQTDAPHQQAAASSAPHEGRRWTVFVPLVAVAIGIGIAAGIAISSYLRRQPARAEISVAVRPVAVKAPTTLPWTYTPEETPAEDETLVSETEEAAEQTPVETPPPPARAEAEGKQAARDEKRAEKQEDKARQAEDDRADEERAGDLDRRRQEREQRRARRNAQKDDEDLTQDPIRRTRDEVHRIREIFEGIP